MNEPEILPPTESYKFERLLLEKSSRKLRLANALWAMATLALMAAAIVLLLKAE